MGDRRASVIAFMGIGAVDPIPPSIASGLNATPGQVSLLFTSRFLFPHHRHGDAGVTAAAGVLVIAGRKALTDEAEELETRPAAEDGVAAFAN